ncbi:CLUMA_CG019940, isoform A [Clunio marinus]|uniref:CLUMA_CG019940, isoform A n=1 Tax=Clunio marinus TaxID=568069 RepID=A0A1J1J6T7_9DIPT|nr:CLUMA_CG019940, isoform A [Clunio marinus]
MDKDFHFELKNAPIHPPNFETTHHLKVERLNIAKFCIVQFNEKLMNGKMSSERWDRMEI